MHTHMHIKEHTHPIPRTQVFKLSSPGGQFTIMSRVDASHYCRYGERISGLRGRRMLCTFDRLNPFSHNKCNIFYSPIHTLTWASNVLDCPITHHWYFRTNSSIAEHPLTKTAERHSCPERESDTRSYLEFPVPLSLPFTPRASWRSAWYHRWLFDHIGLLALVFHSPIMRLAAYAGVSWSPPLPYMTTLGARITGWLCRRPLWLWLLAFL